MLSFGMIFQLNSVSLYVHIIRSDYYFVYEYVSGFST